MEYGRSRAKRSPEAEIGNNVLNSNSAVNMPLLNEGASGTIFPEDVDVSETHIGPVNASDVNIPDQESQQGSQPTPIAVGGGRSDEVSDGGSNVDTLAPDDITVVVVPPESPVDPVDTFDVNASDQESQAATGRATDAVVEAELAVLGRVNPLMWVIIGFGDIYAHDQEPAQDADVSCSGTSLVPSSIPLCVPGVDDGLLL